MVLAGKYAAFLLSNHKLRWEIPRQFNLYYSLTSLTVSWQPTQLMASQVVHLSPTMFLTQLVLRHSLWIASVPVKRVLCQI